VPKSQRAKVPTAKCPDPSPQGVPKDPKKSHHPG